MNSMDLMEGIGDVRSAYIQDVQHDRDRGAAAAKRSWSKARVLLIAAAIAALLVGCAYFAITSWPEGVPTTERAVQHTVQETSTPEEVVPAYTLVVPTEGWQQEGESVWRSSVNTAVSLEIAYYPNFTADDCRNALIAQEPQLQLAAAEDGNLNGRDANLENAMAVRIVPATDGCFALISRYPFEAAEGFGMRLWAIMNTFTVAQ